MSVEFGFAVVFSFADHSLVQVLDCVCATMQCICAKCVIMKQQQIKISITVINVSSWALEITNKIRVCSLIGSFR